MASKKTDKKRTFLPAFKASLPVMAGYLVLGTGFGIIMQRNGYGWWWCALMSLTIYGGSMQYVATSLLSSGATLISTAIISIMVNIRHLFYGIAMVEKYKNTGLKKPYLMFSLTDETFSLLCSSNLPSSINKHRYYFFVSILNQSYWIIGGILGNVIGSSFSFNSKGVEFSMTALFVVIFVEQWEKQKQHLPALTGIIITAICLAVFGSDGFIIPTMLLITVFLFAEKRFIKKVQQ